MSRSNGAVAPVPKLPTASGEFDGFIRDILNTVQEMIDTVTPTMGTVLEREEGGVHVHIDGEAYPRTVSFARKKGVEYVKDQRVSLQRTRGGDWIVDGIVSDSDIDNSVGRNQIAENAVGGVELANGSVSIDSLTTGLQNTIDNLGVRIGNLNAEVNTLQTSMTNAKQDITKLKTDLATEIQDRTSKDNNLQGQINVLKTKSHSH